MNKHIFISVWIGALFSLSMLSSHAQTNKGMLPPLFRTPATFVGIIDSSQLNSADFRVPSTTAVKLSVITKTTSQRFLLPNKVKASSKPITLKQEGKSLTFSCQQDCKTCRLFWWDRNKDGKVQPKRELRCACTKAQLCNIRVKRE